MAPVWPCCRCARTRFWFAPLCWPAVVCVIAVILTIKLSILLVRVVLCKQPGDQRRSGVACLCLCRHGQEKSLACACWSQKQQSAASWCEKSARSAHMDRQTVKVSRDRAEDVAGRSPDSSGVAALLGLQDDRSCETLRRRGIGWGLQQPATELK